MKKSPLKAKTVRLLRKIQDRILKEPRQFVMDSFFTNADLTIPNCGTAACICGWAISLGMKLNPRQAHLRIRRFDEVEKGAKIIGINIARAQSLFFVDQWPHKFEKQWSRTQRWHHKRRARIAVNRIDHFIKTGE